MVGWFVCLFAVVCRNGWPSISISWLFHLEKAESNICSFYRQRVSVALERERERESSGYHYLASGSCGNKRGLFFRFDDVLPDFFSSIALHDLLCATGDGFRF
jgi:hypothetical protein